MLFKMNDFREILIFILLVKTITSVGKTRVIYEKM